MTNVLGLRAEKQGREVRFYDEWGGLPFQVWYVHPKNRRNRSNGAVAGIYGETRPVRTGHFAAILIDEQGTELWPRLVGAPGYWCWLLDLAVEAGFEW